MSKLFSKFNTIVPITVLVAKPLLLNFGNAGLGPGLLADALNFKFSSINSEDTDSVLPGFLPVSPGTPHYIHFYWIGSFSTSVNQDGSLTDSTKYGLQARIGAAAAAKAALDFENVKIMVWLYDKDVEESPGCDKHRYDFGMVVKLYIVTVFKVLNVKLKLS